MKNRISSGWNFLKTMDPRKRRFLVLMAAGLAVIMLMSPVARAVGLRWNGSASIPVGLYVTGDASNQIAEFCPGDPWAYLSVSRGYRSEPGSCPDGRRPLAKPIVATEGDVVDYSPAGIVVDGILVPNTAPLAVDSHGRPIRAWPFGHYEVQPGMAWVASSYNRLSFDSRYFGPIPISSIRSHLKPLLTWR